MSNQQFLGKFKVNKAQLKVVLNSDPPRHFLDIELSEYNRERGEQ